MDSTPPPPGAFTSLFKAPPHPADHLSSFPDVCPALPQMLSTCYAGARDRVGVETIQPLSLFLLHQRLQTTHTHPSLQRSNCPQSKDVVREEGKRGKARARSRGEEKKKNRSEMLARRAVKLLLLAPVCILFGRLSEVEPF